MTSEPVPVPTDTSIVVIDPTPRHPAIVNRSRLNARWNFARVLVNAGVGFLSTPILLGAFSDGDYAGWVLVSSVTSFLTVADIGLAAEVIRSTAKSTANGDRTASYDTMKAVMRVQAALTACMLMFLVGTAIAFPHVFTSVPHDSIRHSQIALVALGLTSLAAMAVNPLIAHQIGMERMEINSQMIIGSRLLALGWTAWSARFGLVWVAVGVAAIYSIAWVVTGLFTFRLAPTFRLRGPFDGPRPYAALSQFARRRLIWFLGLFAAITFDLAIVGRFAFEDLVPFSLATSLGTLAYVSFDALCGTLLPHIAGLGRHDESTDAAWLRTYFRFANGLAALLCLGLGAIAIVLVPYWVGPERAGSVLALLFPMLIVTFLRLSLEGASNAFVGLNQQRSSMWNHVREAAVKLPLGIVLIQWLGGIGLIWAGGAGIAVAMGIVVVRVLPNSAFRLPPRSAVANLAGYITLLAGALIAEKALSAPLAFCVISAMCTSCAGYLHRTGTLATVGMAKAPGTGEHKR